MNRKGGYNISLAGRPSSQVQVLPEPEVLYLPLESTRFQFSDVRVADGERVNQGQTLAVDAGSYGVPLLAPRAGTVDLGKVPGHITLVDVAKLPEEPYDPQEADPHVSRGDDVDGDIKRTKLLSLGVWQFVQDAHTGALPDPASIPQAVIVSTLRLEPFSARGDVQIYKRLTSFTRGLEHIQSLLEYQPIYLVMPDVQSGFGKQLREMLRGYAFIHVVGVPLKYPHDDAALLARSLDLKHDSDHPVWTMGTDGVLAVDRALTLSLPSTVRIISVGGPAVATPTHLRAVPGYPISAILESRVQAGPVRVIDGGVFTGRRLPPEQKGISTDCVGLTIVPEQTRRELLGFLRPGADRQSYSKCFLSALRAAAPEAVDTAVHGERRPCVACGRCESVCPAGIMPHLIHKYIYWDALEEAEEARVDLCVRCGLCSYVCPSKIELKSQMVEAQERIETELHPEGAEA